MAEFDFFPGDPYGNDAVTKMGNCRCGQVFYSNCGNRETLPHKPAEYDGCKWSEWLESYPARPRDAFGCPGTPHNGPYGGHSDPNVVCPDYTGEICYCTGVAHPPSSCPDNPLNVIETDLLPPRVMIVGEFTHAGTDIVRELAGPLTLIPYRECCYTLVGLDAHEPRCPSRYFAEGQTVLRRESSWFQGRDRLVVQEDTVSSDRTFENETRLNPRTTEYWVL